MKLTTILLLCIFTCSFTSCSGQVTMGNIPLGHPVSETSKNTWIVFQDSKNNYWFGSDGKGVYRYDGKIMMHFSSRDGLCNDRIREIQEDKAGNIYFTTLEGISKFDGRKFTTLKVVAGNDPDNWKAEANDLWFKGGKKGPYRYDGKNLYKLDFPKSDMEDEYYKKYPGTTIDPYDVYYIYKDSKGNMWFGTGAFGIYRYDGKSVSNLFEDHLTNTPTGGSFGIRSIMEDRKGQFWFCNTKYRYNILPGDSPEKGQDFINYTKEKSLSVSNDALGGDRIYYQSIVEDAKGDVWMQTYQGGIWRFDGKKLIQYPVTDGKETAKVIAMYNDNSGGLWLGTNGSGVYKFNGKSFEKYKF